ncbi:alpha/beta fold hydrolase [Streptomyces actuosus]|uniref:Alpha/beta fold hydrolase n=1 Tax=Streptomyces actuosus TaxID=1885 RepID=A0ABS2VHX4_STRAS|nr:alpha/beta fold hydrolase [Streptomyces actuosus]MBN0042687.1 alpha/beta fold hydrolase [Streptomyces actuosus]
MPYFASPVDGTRLHHVDHGPADGPVIAFVNSAYFGTDMWEAQMIALAEEGFRCVGLDRRGHGRSDDVWGGFDLDSLADDVQGLLDHLDLHRVTLVAHSVGTAEAVRCLTRNGTRRVDRVALVSGVAPGLVRCAGHPDGLAPETLAAFNETVRRDRAAFYADGADAFFARHLPGNELSDAYVQSMVRACHVSTPRAGVALRDLMAVLDLAPEVAALDLPVLVVHGDSDMSAPLELTGRRTAALAPQAELKVYENGGHGLFATHAAQLTEDIRKFASLMADDQEPGTPAGNGNRR